LLFVSVIIQNWKCYFALVIFMCCGRVKFCCW